MSRGIRNNNPGNIRISGVRYLGEVSPSTDRAFKQFSAPEWGYRAMFVVLHTYRKRYGLHTLGQMIDRYAPPVENDTRRYVEAVERWAGIACDAKIDTLSADQMLPIVGAMSRMENGQAANQTDLERGWELFTRQKP